MVTVADSLTQYATLCIELIGKLANGAVLSKWDDALNTTIPSEVGVKRMGCAGDVSNKVTSAVEMGGGLSAQCTVPLAVKFEVSVTSLPSHTGVGPIGLLSIITLGFTVSLKGSQSE
jgi:hypothetical protein